MSKQLTQAYILDESGNKYNTSGQQVVTEAEMNQARNDAIPGQISSEATVIANSVAAGKSAGGSGTGSGNGSSTTPGLDMSSQSLLDNAAASKDKVDNILNEMGTQKNTGSGAAAASGTDYSWDVQGTNKANTQLEIDKNNAKQEALANRQTIEQNAQAYQQQADMMKYSANQSAQSAGWTGGYVLDQNRQMEYLKSSIQAQMYGAMELQKYGYETALAAARLSYDLNQQEFAHQYYMDAVNIAVTEAQQTGYYVSAEVKDMMSQYNVAQEKLKINPNDEQAAAVTKGVKDWFKANFNSDVSISDTAVKTLSLLTSELSAAQSNLQMYMNTYFEQLTRIQAADSAAAEKIKNDPSYFIIYGEDGKEQYDPVTGKIVLGNFSGMSKEEVASMLATNSKNKPTFESYVDSTYDKVIADYLQTVAVKSGENISYAVKEEDLEKLLQGNESPGKYGELLEGYSYTTKAGDNPVTITIKNGKATVDVQVTGVSKQEAEKAQQQETSVNAVTDYNNGNRNHISFSEVTKGYSNLTKYTMSVQNSALDKYGKIDDDFDIDIGGKNYDLDVDWKAGGNQGPSQTTWDNAQEYLKEAYPNQQRDELVIYEGNLWFYSDKHNAWGFIQMNTGGKRLLEDLSNATKGNEPGRWSK